MFRKLKNLFKEKDKSTKYGVVATEGIYFNSFNGNAYENEVFRSAVDSIAKQMGKLQPRYVVEDGEKVDLGDKEVNQVLQSRPNPYVNTYDFIYKLTTHYFLKNNAFAYLDKDESGRLLSMWNLDPLNMEFLADGDGVLYCKMIMDNGKEYLLPYEDIFHIRRHFNSDELLGDSNHSIMGTLETSNIQMQGINKSIRNNGKIKGILKIQQAVGAKTLKKQKESFMKDFLNVENSGGIAATDGTMEYQPIEDNYVDIPTDQVEAIEKKITDYLGVNKSIIDGSYTEDEYLSFYTSVVEPFALQCSQEMTGKMFTDREQFYGNRIEFSANNLRFMSNKSKVNYIKELAPLRLLTVNEARAIMGLPPIVGEEGNIRLQTLNVVNSDKVDKYQLGKELGKNSTEEKE